MADPSNPGEKLSALGIRLRRGETALTALTLAENSSDGRPGKQGCLVLTNQRMFHISGPGPSDKAQVNSALMRDVGDAVLENQPRYHGFLFPAGFFLVIGFAYFIATAVAGAFQPIVLVPTLLLGGGFLALWWYSGGDPVIRVRLGDALLEVLIDEGQRQEGFALLEKLTEVKREN